MLTAYKEGRWEIDALQRVLSHEFDFMGPWVGVHVQEANDPLLTVLVVSFSPPAGRDLAKAEAVFVKATRRADSGDVSNAVRDFLSLTKTWPEVPKFWRALGQAYLVSGQLADAEDALLKSLALDPLAPDALTLLGNLYAGNGKLDRALELYERSLELDRNVHAMTNAAGILSKSGLPDEGLRLFREAVKLDASYPNAWYGLALSLTNLRDTSVLPEAFRALDTCLATIGERTKSVQIWDAASSLLQKLSAVAARSLSRPAEVAAVTGAEADFAPYGLPVRFETAALPGVDARIELGWVHHREYHRVLVNSEAGFERVHLMHHELEHAALANLARKHGRNRWFASSNESFAEARRTISGDLAKLSKSGIGAADVESLASMWIDGINSQLYNFPIDLLIEATLLREKRQFRELWFYSVHKQLQLAAKIAEDRELQRSSPRIIYRSSCAMNGAFALWFDSVFPKRTDFVDRFKRTDAFPVSRRLFEMWKASEASWEPGAELGWVDEWADVLGLRDWYVWTDGNG